MTSAPLAAPATIAEEFLATFAAQTGGCAADERFIFCGFAGDPHHARTAAWRPRAWCPGDPLPINPRCTNGYVAVSTFRRAPDRTWRRRTELFRSGRAFMVDDVGTKVPERVVARVAPTARVETSAGNEQWWYFLGEPLRDAALFGGMIRAFIEQRLLTADPGMNGVNRVGRVPGFINGKRGQNFRVRLLAMDAQRLFSPRELVRAFGLRVARPRPAPPAAPAARKTGVAGYVAVLRLLKDWGMLRGEPNVAGWQDIECPWRAEHTARAGTGAALREPAAENEWRGAFQCHHGHCVDRTWRELEAWIAEEAAAHLEAAAALAVLEGE